MWHLRNILDDYITRGYDKAELAVWQPGQPRAVTDVETVCGRGNPTLQYVV